MTKCTGCGATVDPLELFPKNRCLECYSKSQDAEDMMAGMNGEKLARMWTETV
jgi:hypothetical protein